MAGLWAGGGPARRAGLQGRVMAQLRRPGWTGKEGRAAGKGPAAAAMADSWYAGCRHVACSHLGLGLGARKQVAWALGDHFAGAVSPGGRWRGRPRGRGWTDKEGRAAGRGQGVDGLARRAGLQGGAGPWHSRGGQGGQARRAGRPERAMAQPRRPGPWLLGADRGVVHIGIGPYIAPHGHAKH